MKRVYVYNFIPLNVVKIHTVTTQEELETISDVISNNPNTYKIIYQLDAESSWKNFCSYIIEALDNIFKECGSNIRFSPMGTERYTEYAIQPIILNEYPFVCFTNSFYTQVRSIISDLGAEVVRITKNCYDENETVIVFRRKEDVKADTM